MADREIEAFQQSSIADLGNILGLKDPEICRSLLTEAEWILEVAINNYLESQANGTQKEEEETQTKSKEVSLQPQLLQAPPSSQPTTLQTYSIDDETGPFADLSDEIILHIFRFCSERFVKGIGRCICKRWKSICVDFNLLKFMRGREFMQQKDRFLLKKAVKLFNIHNPEKAIELLKTEFYFVADAANVADFLHSVEQLDSKRVEMFLQQNPDIMEEYIKLLH